MPTKRRVTLAPGVDFPARHTETAEIDGCRVDVVVVPEEGRLVAAEVRVRRLPDGPPVTGEVIRAVPVASIVARAADKELRLHGAKGFMLGTTPEQLRRLGPGSPEALEAVASVYAQAYASGESATRAVEQTFGLAPATAARWIRRAREQGLLKIPRKHGRTDG